MLNETLSHKEFTYMIVTLWAIWSARRKANHEKVFQSPLSTHNFNESYVFDLQVIAKPNIPVSRPPRDDRERWLPPQGGALKINVDGAFSREGTFGASAIVVSNISNPCCMEALACREGMALAEDLYLQNIVIVLDCKEVVNDINQGSNGGYVAIIREIRDRKSGLHRCSFVHERRSFNFEAHTLAKHAASQGIGRHVWLGHPYDPFTLPVNIVCFSLSKRRLKPPTSATKDAHNHLY